MEENPYAAPASQPPVPADQPFDLAELDDPTIKRLRNHSHSIRASVVLIILGTVGVATAASFFLTSGSPGSREWGLIGGAIVLPAVLGIATVIGLIRRPHWGRVLGMVCAGLMILTISLPSVIGVLLLIALIQGRPLFGPERITHRQIDAEWKARRQRKREAKRRAKLERAA